MNLIDLTSLSKNRVEDFFNRSINTREGPAPELKNAITYSFLNGGKRIRPLIIYTIGNMLSCPLEKLDPPACAIELIHTYSLIHDDLPAMDNADLRRGKPSCHKEFGEATAILAGDALQPLAFEILATSHTLSATQRLEMIKILAEACGIQGMAAGQTIDLLGANTPESIRQMYQLKTGALLVASVKLSLCAANITDHSINTAFHSFANNIGLAYQIQDDLLDIQDSETTGKTQNLDLINKKITYSSLNGVEKTFAEIHQLYENASKAIEILGKKGDILHQLASFLLQRKK